MHEVTAIFDADRKHGLGNLIRGNTVQLVRCERADISMPWLRTTDRDAKSWGGQTLRSQAAAAPMEPKATKRERNEAQPRCSSPNSRCPAKLSGDAGQLWARGSGHEHAGPTCNHDRDALQQREQSVGF